MKYYVVEIATGDSKVSGKGIYEYDSEQKAVSTYHKKIGSAMDSDLYDTHLIEVIDSYGTQIQKPHFYQKPIEKSMEIEE